MHHKITDEQGNVVGLICVERSIQASNILFCEFERLADLLALARSLGAQRTQVVVPKAMVGELESLGWKLSKDLRVMSMEQT